jgi:vacuolar-type H+-ATPase subunit I/STV1
MNAEPAKTLSLVPKMPDLMEKVDPVVEEARALVVATKEDVETARSKGRIINALISEVEATFRPIKQAQDAAKKVTLEQEKKPLAPLQEAKSIVAGKITAWDQAERKRIEEAQRKQAQEEERRRQLALENARKKLDKLMAGMTDDKQMLATLDNQLADPETTEEEAEVIRSQVRTIQARIDTAVERAAEVEQKVEEAAQPVAPVQGAVNVKTATGVSQEKVISGINTKVLLRYLAGDDCPFDADQFIDWKQTAIKRIVNGGANLPGVSWKFQAKTRF